MREVQVNLKRFRYLNNHFNKQNSDEFTSLFINPNLGTGQIGNYEIISE